jgi:hypothetical protein
MLRRLRQRLTRAGRAAALAPLLAAACGAAPHDAAVTTCPIPTAIAAPTFSGNVLPALRSSCGAGSASLCHGTPSPAGHVAYAPSLTAFQVWDQLVNRPPSAAPQVVPPGVAWLLVAPGDAAHSWLIEKVTRDDPGGAGQAYGNRMPYTLPNLCDATVQTLRNWIERGAPND